MHFKLQSFNRNISEQDLLDDLRAVYKYLDQQSLSLSYRSYTEYGKYSASTIATRFGSWNSALKLADLPLTEEKEVSEEALFKNLETVWTTLGRQPVTRDMQKPLSTYPFQIYASRYGTWRKSLERFIEYLNEDEPASEVIKDENQKPKEVINKRTTRSISDRMRFRILSRDGFTCQSCGRSPIKERGVELHVDHILPWSKGGETTSENLQTKCSTCNLGKGNAFNQ